MRVAALYDIHGNLPALEAALAEVRAAGVDQIVIGGDIMPGPMVSEVLACLLNLDMPVQFIRGNCETAMLATAAGKDSGLSERYRVVDRWVVEHLSPEQKRVIAGWPLSVRIPVDGLGEVLFCHASPRNENDIFTRLTPEAALLPIFKGIGAQVVVCGHTHMQFDRMVGTVRVVNAGSVGTPFGEPGAYWLLLGPDIQFRRTDYDRAATAARVRATDYPLAEEYAATDVLQPKAEAEMVEIYTRAGLK